MSNILPEQVLLTGVAGFIGYHTAEALLKAGTEVVGVDIVNAYYDVTLKEARLERLKKYSGFSFYKADIADKSKMEEIWALHPRIKHIINLAAQAGVRYSLEKPFEYIHSNIVGHLVMLELARHRPGFEHFVYASTSSVYGDNKKLPFSLEDRTDTPLSIYAATKKSDEVITHSYSHLFRIPTTGLRFFTVYGPWGRPDMSAFLFAKAILAGQSIRVFNHGKMRRDYTYIDDIVSGIIAALQKPPLNTSDQAPYKIYNLGNNTSEELMRFISLIEENLGMKATINFEPIQPGDVPESLADIEHSKRDLGYMPHTPIELGVPKFIEWFKEYHLNAQA